jgi:hypothetical protein
MPAVLDALETSAEPPSIIHTTLYDLMSALQDAAEPGDEELVVTSVMHLLRSGRLTFLRAVDGLEDTYAATAPHA